MATRLRSDDDNPDQQTIAYGYVRVTDPDEQAITHMRAAIGDYCRAHRWRLVTVFCDRDDDGHSLARPALAGLLDALSVSPAAVLVVPEVDHLSPYGPIRAALVQRFRQADHRLETLASTASGRASTGDRSCPPE